MGSNWETVKLEDIATIIDSRHKTPKYSEHGYPMVRVVDVSGGKLSFENTKKVSDEVYKDFSKGRDPELEDIIITRVGSYGNVAYVNSKDKFCLGQNTALIIPKEKDRFLYYSLISPHIKRQIEEMVVGAVQKTISIKAIKSLEVRLPPKKIKTRITSTLSAIDEKIEINKSSNQTLGKMAQALFKSWFVDFDPVIDNALAAGSELPDALQHRVEIRKKAHALQKQNPSIQTLPAATQRLFPSEFEHCGDDSLGIQGWIPKGWEVSSIHDLVDTVSQTYKLKEVEEVIFLNTGDIEDGRFLHNNYSATKDLPGQAKKSIAKGDILYSEIRPKNKRFALVNFDSMDYVVSTKLMVLRAKEGIDPLLPYFILTQEKTINKLQHVAEHRSGTFPQITFKELADVTAILPRDKALIDYFVSSYLKPFYDRQYSSIVQNQLLEKLRDTVLPKLISGELTLNKEVAL